MTALRFGVLGPLEVTSDGAQVSVPSGRRRAVLARLLVAAGAAVTPDALIEAGWGDHLPADPRGALNTVVSRLRAILGAETVPSEPAGYRLDVPAEMVDALRFDRLLSEAASAEADRAMALYDEALSLWRGRAYVEFADREFAAVEAQRLELRRCDAVESCAALRLETGSVERAVAMLESLHAEQPFRDYALHLLMTGLHRLGRTEEALRRYRDHRDRLLTELGLDPAPALAELERRILGREPSPGQRVGAAPDPPAWRDTSTSFVGRDAAMTELVQAVCTSRVTTVTGFGGTGKSRLVAQTLPLLCARFGSAPTIVELGPMSPGQVAGAVASAYGRRRPTDSALSAVLDAVGDGLGLLVLDGCEHVQAEVARLVEAVVSSTARLHVLVTSRRRLDVLSERALALAPLPVPDPASAPSDAERTAAVRLLGDRVRQLRSDFAVGPDTIDDLAEICRLVDGLPLALELLAARVADRGTAAVRRDLAAEAGRDTPGAASLGERLGAVVDWSFGLLDEDQQRLLMLLSVVVGEVDAEDVRCLSELAHGWNPRRAGESLAALVDASLLSTSECGGRARFRMLGLVRAYATRRLVAAHAEQHARRAHAEWVRRAAERAATDCLGPASATVLARMDDYRADIVAALRWAVATGACATAGSIAGSVQLCTHWGIGPSLAELIATVPDRCPGGPETALTIAAAGCAEVDSGRVELGRRLGARAVLLAATPAERYLARRCLGVAALYAGRQAAATRWFGEMARLDELPAAYRSDGHSSLALLAGYHGDHETACAEANIAVTAAESAGATPQLAFALYSAGEAAVGVDPARAVDMFRRSADLAATCAASQVGLVSRVAALAQLVRLERVADAVDLALPLLGDLRRAGSWPQLWTTLRIIAELFAATGRPQDAVLLLSAAAGDASAPPVAGTDVERYRTVTEQLRRQIGDRTFEGIRALAHGIPRSRLVDRAAQLVATYQD